MSPATAPASTAHAREAARLLAWSALYLASLLWALSHLLPQARISLAWPAAGVGVLWLLSERSGAPRRRALLSMVLVTVLGSAGRGIELEASLAWGVVNAGHALVGATVLQRVLGPRPRPLRQVSDLVGLTAASLLAGAVSGLGASAVATGAFGLPWVQGLLLLVLRNTVSTLVVVAAGLGLLALADRGLRRGPGSGLERLLATVTAVAVTAAAFEQLPSALVFLLLPPTLWVAVRAGVLATTAVVSVQSVVVVGLTLAGRGPFAAVQPEDHRAMAALSLLAVVVLVALCLALAEHERDTAHTESRRARDRLQQNLDAALVGQATLDLPGPGGARVLAVNPALAALVQRPAEELVGTEWLQVVVPQDRSRLSAVLGALHRGSRQGWHGELRLRVGAGVEAHDVWVDAVLGRVEAAPDEPVTVTAQFLDTSARKRAEEQLSHLALHDELTGLPNRALWRDRAERALETATGEGGRVGVLYVDLDRFKAVNDEHGHEVGDALLVEVAGRLSCAVRPEDTVARIGGDEFVVLCPDVPDAGALAAVSERLLACLGPVVEVGARRFTVTASIGTAFSDAGVADLQSLLRDADAALYSAKASGRARVEHSGAGERLVRSAMPLLDELSRALALGELVVHHQPVVDLTTGAPVATEALIRWQHPERGLLGPAEWLDTLEMSDLIYAAGLHVLETACADAASLQERYGPLAVHVNVSARQLDRPGLVESVARTLRRTRLPAHLLVLELTETRLLSVHGTLLRDLHALRELGVRLAADDVGTGYSTLAHLVEMPIDVLKLDRSFVAGLAGGTGGGQSAHAVTSGVLAIARGLGVECVAEGVEDSAQAGVLHGLGYTTGQGWLWGRAMPMAELEGWLERAPRPVLVLPQPRGSEPAGRPA